MQRLVLFLALLPGMLVAQLNSTITRAPIHLQAGARAAAMGYNTAALNDGAAIFHNPAITSYWQDTRSLMSYQQRFFISGLHQVNGGIGLGLEQGSLGLGVSYTGSQLASRSKIGLYYAREFGEHLAASLKVNYQGNSVSEAVTFHGATFELGLYAPLSEKFALGFTLYNPNRSYLDQISGQRLPAVGRLGLMYSFTEGTRLTAEVRSMTEQDWRYGAGLEVDILENAWLRVGSSLSEVYTFHLGLGARLDDQWDFNITYEYHQFLRSNLVYGLQLRFP